MASTTVDQAADLIKQRLRELEDERKRLESALRGLAAAMRRPGRPVRSKATSGATRRRRRTGTRADQALTQLQKSPGLTAGELASKLGTKPNYIYRVLGQLEKDGSVRKKGKVYLVRQ